MIDMFTNHTAKPTMKIYIPRTPDADSLHLLRNHLDKGITVTTGEDIPDDFHVIVAGRPSDEQLQASSHLHTLLIPFAGLPAETSERMVNYPDVAIYNLHHNNITTGQMALALLLACARQLIPAHNQFRQHDWSSRYLPLEQIMLYQKTALILGYGSIGQYIAPVLTALGLDVIGIRRTQADPDNGIYTLDSLHDLLPKADVLMVTLPATDETTGLLGAHEFDLLPDKAIVVNVGRGAVIQQEAFYNALKSGKLHAGASDVWYDYPMGIQDPPFDEDITNHPPADMPFHELDNMIMSPHRGGAFGNADVERMRYARIAELMNRLARGESLPNRVDLSQGY